MGESLNKRFCEGAVDMTAPRGLKRDQPTCQPRTNDVPAVAVRHHRGSIAGRDWA